MKYICLGYLEPGNFEGMTEDQRHLTFDECFEYHDHLRANGHMVAGKAGNRRNVPQFFDDWRL